MNARLAVVSIITGLALTPVAGAQQTEPGERWETTTEMQMPGMGMSMPARTQQVCLPAGSSNPPEDPNNKNCEMYDVRQSGSTTSWKMRCTGKDAATGSGEITYQGRQSYSGKMAMDMEGQSMTMKMSGKRLPGECDAGKLKRDIEKTQAQSAMMTAQQCAEMARGMQVQVADGSMQSVCDAKYKADFCKRVSTEEGYDLLAVRDKNPVTGVTDLEAAGKACAVDTVAVHDKLCKAAVNKESSMLFLARHCPTEAGPLAKKECAGRTFTTPPAEKYREFCSTYARHGLMGSAGSAGAAAGTDNGAAGSSTGAAQDGTVPPPKDTAVEQGKKALKKLFPF